MARKTVLEILQDEQDAILEIREALQRAAELAHEHKLAYGRSPVYRDLAPWVIVVLRALLTDPKREE